MIDRMSALDIEPIEGGGLRLTQQEGIEDPNIIELHPIQIRLLAERSGLLVPIPDAGRICDLERRLGVLADKVQDFACDRFTRKEIIESCDSGFEIVARLDALCDLALELDGGRLTPEEPPDEEQPSAPASNATSSKPSPVPQDTHPELF